MKLLPLLLLLGWMMLFSSCNDNPTPSPTTITEQTTDTVPGANNGNLDTGEKKDYDNQGRVVWQRPELIINLLGNGSLADKTVADIGAGTGWFTLRLAPRVKKVIALDIDPSFISYLDSVKQLQLTEDIQPRLETRLTPRDRASLDPGEVNGVLIVNTFMYIDNKVEYLQSLREGITEGGRLVIVDFKRKRTPIGPPAELRLPLYLAEDYLYEAGYRNIEVDDCSLDYQYIVMAEK